MDEVKKTNSMSNVKANVSSLLRRSMDILTHTDRHAGESNPEHRVVTMTADPNAGTVLTWRDLEVVSKKAKKVLLHGVSGQVSGGLCAVMGPSGSGKSTLLNTLAMRLDKTVSLKGDMRINGKPYDTSLLKQVSGYVMQDDLLNGQLTVEETLNYTARLRCPPEYTEEQRKEVIEQALTDMGLRHVRHVIVGDPLKKGISGGERKRLCVAIELLTKLRLLFLDEPTSGLDSVTALLLIRTLKRLAAGGVSVPKGAATDDVAIEMHELEAGDGNAPPVALPKPAHAGCTIMCTIHQPQSKIFQEFDTLILLQGGSTVFAGPAMSSLDHFAGMGYPCPPLTNPADHLMDLITVRLPRTSVGTVPLQPGDLMPDPEQLKAYYKNLQVDIMAGADRPVTQVRQMVPWRRQYSVLLQRTMRENLRKRTVMATQIGQALVIAVLIGTVFLQIGTDQQSAVRRQPVLFFTAVNQGIFASMQVINSFPSERLLSLRERAAGTYYASAYFLAKCSAEIIVQLPVPFLFSCVVYWLIGLQAVASKFFIYAGFMMLCSTSATSMALMVSTWCRTVDLSVSVLPMLVEVSRLFGGFFLSPANLPKYFSWLDALSFVKYTYVGISLNELTGLTLTCTDEERLADGSCPIANGDETIERLGLDTFSIKMCAGILIAYIFFCRFMAYVGLRIMKH
eukprot:jgi/Mesvir1/24454/Mv21823-RA.1